MLHDLHWLPIKKRVIYKLVLMVYKSQQDIIIYVLVVADLQVWFNENQMIMNDDKHNLFPSFLSDTIIGVFSRSVFYDA